MTDYNSMQYILGPANAALSANLQFIRNYQATGQIPTASSSSASAAANYAQPKAQYGGYPAQPDPNAWFQQMFMFQMMMQMMQKYQQQSDVNINDLMNGQGSSTDLGDTRYDALSMLGQSLKKGSSEADVTDGDSDGNVVSDADVTRLKTAVNDEQFSKTDLKWALQYTLTNGSLDKVDELLDLTMRLDAAGVVSADDLLSNTLVEKLSQERRDKVAKALADDGLTKSDGKTNTSRMRYLMGALDSNSPDKTLAFGKSVVKSLVQTWIKPSVAQNAPDRTMLVHFLNVLGFQFNTDGTLKADSEQPFAVSAV